MLASGEHGSVWLPHIFMDCIKTDQFVMQIVLFDGHDTTR